MSNIIVCKSPKEIFKDIKLDYTSLSIEFGDYNQFDFFNFDISPKEYLTFAKEDLKIDNDRGLINALSNAKRAIDCLIESVLKGLKIDCKNILDDAKEFSNVIFSLLSINNNKTNQDLHLMGALYSVILEMITNIIYKKNEEKLFYIKNKEIRKELQKLLNDTAKVFFEENNIKNFEDSPINKILDNINKPTNKDKLIKPFEILDIKLTDFEKEI